MALAEQMSRSADQIFTPASPIWQVSKRSPEKELRLIQELKVFSIVAAILVQRGFENPELAYNFLNPSLDALGDPRTLPDYDKAVKEILKAKENNDLIFIHGDYDVDGVTSSAIFHRFLKKIGCNIHTHVPHRMREGYGIHLDAVDRAHEMGAKLFLTCDCGIAAHEQVQKARSYGMTVVVTDHHEIAETIPEAAAVVNCHRKDSLYPEHELSGAGVVFRLCEGITKELNHPVAKYRRAFLDLACLGTIADVMPLIGENRIIAKFGLEQLGETQKVGLQALMKAANVGQDPTRPLQSTHVGWQLGPRLNAVGRIEDAAKALQLLIEYDPAAAETLASQLEAVNTDRRARTQTIVEQAVEMVIENHFYDQSMIVVADAAWHPGIVGIAAGRLVEKFNRPALVMTVDEKNGICKGSARSIAGFHFAEAIWAFPELIKGGGHAMAAGCSFPLEKLDEIRGLLNGFAEQRIDPNDLVPKVHVDLEVQPREVTRQTVEELGMLEPFGCANPEPSFLARNVELSDILPTKNPSHVRLKLNHGEDKRIAGIAFHLGPLLEETVSGDCLDLLFKPEINEYRGSRTLQWQVRQLRDCVEPISS